MMESYADFLNVNQRLFRLANGLMEFLDEESVRQMDEVEDEWKERLMICPHKGCARGFLSVKGLWNHRLDHLVLEPAKEDQEYGADIMTEEEDDWNDEVMVSENENLAEYVQDEVPPTLECMVIDDANESYAHCLVESDCPADSYEDMPMLDYYGDRGRRYDFGLDLTLDNTRDSDSALGDSTIEKVSDMDTSNEDNNENSCAARDDDFSKYLEIQPVLKNKEGFVLVADVQKRFPNHRCMLCKHCDTYYFNIIYLRLHIAHVHPEKDIKYLCEETVTTYDLPIVTEACGCIRYIAERRKDRYIARK